MKRVVFSGYYGLGNIGDEAVLAGAVSSFKALDEDVCITVLSAHPEETVRLHGVDAVDRYSLRSVFEAIRGSDVVLSGGGSLLQDITSARSAAYYLAIILMAELLRKPVMVFGQGIGPIIRRITKLQMKFLLNRVSMITVRDQGSAELLRTLGVVGPPMHVTADPSLALEPAGDEDAQRALADAGVTSGRPILGVALRPWRVGDGWAATIAEGLDAAATRIGATPVFLPMQHPCDIDISRNISERMTVENIVLQEPMSPALAKAVVGRMSVMVAMRLHALMFAAAQSKPVVALAYDPKVLAFADLLPAEVPALDALSPSPEQLAGAVESVCGNASIISESLNAKLPEWRRDAVLNARLALELMSSRL